MNQFVRPCPDHPRGASDPELLEAPRDAGGAQMNTMVLTSRQPVVFDTGVSADEHALARLRSPRSSNPPMFAGSC